LRPVPALGGAAAAFTGFLVASVLEPVLRKEEG